MRHRLTGMIAAASLAVAGMTAPAAAQSDEQLLRNIIAGAAILGIGAAIIDKRKDRKEAEEKRRKEARAAAVARDRNEFHGRDHDWRGPPRIIDGEVRSQHARGPKAGRGYKKTPLPARCRVTVDTPRGERSGYSSRCLERRYKHENHLPGQCEVLVRTSDGLRAVYGERCLDRDGWTTPTRR